MAELFRQISALSVTFFVGLVFCVAQSTEIPNREFKFGEISPEEFALEASGADSAAAALKIFDVGHCDFNISNARGFTYVFKRHVRYKILNKNGYDLANLDIALYRSSNSSKENMVSMNATTYNLENGKIVESKLSKDAKFTEALDENYTIKKYTLPNVKEGSIIEFRYTIESDFIFTLRGWTFQSDIPTLWSEYNIRIPEYFNYKVNLNGYWPVETPIKKQENKSYVAGLASTAQYTKYVARAIPALKDEPYVTTLDDYRAKIEFELQGTRFPNEPYQDYTGNWPKIINGLMTDENFGQYINKRAQAKSLLEGAPFSGTASELAKIKQLYHYVTANVKWNEEHSLYTDHLSPKTLFEKRAGNSSDINLALISLLKAADITVYPVLVSTRENGAHPGYPNISKFNNVVALAVYDSTALLLDACDPLMPMGMLSFPNLVHQGFLLDMDKEEGQWISLEASHSGESSYNYNLTLNEDNTLAGSVLEIHRGYNGLSRRNNYRSKSSESEYIKDYKEDRAGLDILTYEILNIDSAEESLTEKLKVTISDNVEEAGDLVYFPPLLYERTKENPFKHDERKFPVDFGFPIKETFRITVKFPENYTVEKLPKSIVYKLADDNGSFKISYLSEGKVVLVNSVIDLKKGAYSAEEYFDLKELFKIITERQAEQIVFKKM
ncbi:DUF3857 domain-containing protein [Parapedobacter sp. DT-150]|uniref:DUF3857 domain-containing protein n=1 Tax=Parapedobacter sp. DT-150 TaxID=3396162 RepID=UPI003F1E0A17